MNYKNIKDIDDFRKTNIGFIFQFHYLINYLTVKENIKIANEKATENEIHNLLKILRIENLSNKYPNEISGGQRQRVAIARALLNDPEFILADEPTGNLDPQTSAEVLEVLKTINALGKTIIMATHDYALLMKYPSKTLKCEDTKIFEVVQRTV